MQPPGAIRQGGTAPGLRQGARLRYKPVMLLALLRAIGALAEPPLRRVVALGLGLAVLTLALLWLAVAAALYQAHCLPGGRSIGSWICWAGSPCSD